MTVTHSQSSKFVLRSGNPAAIGASGQYTVGQPMVSIVAGTAVHDVVWEPQAVFLHNWKSPVINYTQFSTVVGESRTGFKQRNGLSDKPKFSTTARVECFNEEHWRNLRQMLSKQETNRYLLPLYSDAISNPVFGTLVNNVPQPIIANDFQAWSFSVPATDLTTRRLFVGQRALVSVSDSLMSTTTNCNVIGNINHASRGLQISGVLRDDFYGKTTVKQAISRVAVSGSSGTAIANRYGGNIPFVSGTSVVTITNKPLAAWDSVNFPNNPPVFNLIGGNAYGDGSAAYVYGNNAGTNPAKVKVSKAGAVGIKPNDRILFVSHTMCRAGIVNGVMTDQSLSLEPYQIRTADSVRSSTGNGFFGGVVFNTTFGSSAGEWRVIASRNIPSGPTYQSVSPTATGTFTMQASSALNLGGAHSLTVNQAVRVSSTGTLPAPLAAGTNYYVRDVTGTTVTLSASEGPGALLNITTAGTGTHSIVAVPNEAQKCNAVTRVYEMVVTDAIYNTLRASGASSLDDPQEIPVVVYGLVTSTYNNQASQQNSLMQAVVVVRDAEPRNLPIISTPMGCQVKFLTHNQADDGYLAGESFPTARKQNRGSSSFSSKFNSINIVLNNYGQTTVSDPVGTTSGNSTALFPTNIVDPLQSGAVANVNEARNLGASNIDIAALITMSGEDSTEQRTELGGEAKAIGLSEFGFANGTSLPPSPSIVPWSLSINIIYTPKLPTQRMRIYPLVEADPSPLTEQISDMRTASNGSTTVSATQTSGAPALDPVDAIPTVGGQYAVGWNQAAYPPFASNPTGGAYPATAAVVPLLLGPFDYSQQTQANADSSIRSESIGIGRTMESYPSKPFRQFRVSAKFVNRKSAFDFLRLFASRRGRLAPMWFPSLSNDYEPTSVKWNSGASAIEVGGKFVNGNLLHGQQYLYLRGITAAGTTEHYIVAVASLSASGTITLASIGATLASSSTAPYYTNTAGASNNLISLLTTGTITRITTAHLCFFDEDAITETWTTDEVMSTTFTLTEDPSYIGSVSPLVTPPSQGPCGCDDPSCRPPPDDCIALGGVYKGCTAAPGCCLCILPDTVAVFEGYCYDGCFDLPQGPTGESTSPGCLEAGPGACSPTGVTVHYLNPVPGTGCNELQFQKPAPAACAGSGSITAHLNLKTGQWTVNPGFGTNSCCNSSCQCCNPSQSSCSCFSCVPSCVGNCPPVSAESTCGSYTNKFAVCNIPCNCCNTTPNCRVNCGQPSSGSSGCNASTADCCTRTAWSVSLATTFGSSVGAANSKCNGLNCAACGSPLINLGYGQGMAYGFPSNYQPAGGE